MRFPKLIIISVLIFSRPALAASPNYLLLKDDINKDGINDRIVFASHGISGFFLSSAKNKKIDSFNLRQGNRTIFFTSSSKLGGPFVQLTEEVGFYKVVTLMKYENKVFKHLKSYALPNRTYFSIQKIAATDPFAEPNEKSTSCKKVSPGDAAIANAILSADALKNSLIADVIKNKISPDCKLVLGDDYKKFESQVILACTVDDQTIKHSFLSCLDKYDTASLYSSKYRQSLVENIFGNGPKISCATSSSDKPRASFDDASGDFMFYRTNPEEPERNFQLDYIHEVAHKIGIAQDASIDPLIEGCSQKSLKLGKGNQNYYSGAGLQELLLDGKKNGVEVNIPSQNKEVPQTSVASAMSDGSKALNSSASDSDTGFAGLVTTSKGAFNSFAPVMTAAYKASLNAAYAGDSISKTMTSSTSSPLPISISSSGGSQKANSQNITADAAYEIANPPSTTAALSKGELGNGITTKIQALAAEEPSGRSPASTSSGSQIQSGGRNISSIPSTDRPDVIRNSATLEGDENFRKLLTSGTYSEIKAAVLDPKNDPRMKRIRLQYAKREEGQTITTGSTDPVQVLYDLGSKFSIRRVTHE
jgi:hypothetical protein